MASTEGSGDTPDVTQEVKKTEAVTISAEAASAPATAPATAAVPPAKPAAGESQAPASVPREMFVKHPLQHRWTLWYCKADRTKAWEQCLKEVTAFETVEDFWALYNHIQLASGLSFGSDYYLFKEGIKPMWEDSKNVKGGRWLVTVERMKRNELLDHFWLELLMAMIGEQFDDYGEHLCGAVVNVRQKGDKVSLWTKDATEDEVNRRIGTILKAKCSVNEQIQYEAHTDTSQKSCSVVKPRLRV